MRAIFAELQKYNREHDGGSDGVQIYGVDRGEVISHDVPGALARDR